MMKEPKAPMLRSTAGAELLWGKLEQNDGQSADNVRSSQFSAQYEYCMEGTPKCGFDNHTLFGCHWRLVRQCDGRTRVATYPRRPKLQTLVRFGI